MNFTSEELKQLLSQPLPGYRSHMKMAPESRLEELKQHKPTPESAKKSAVMILFFHDADVLKMVMIRRSLYVGIHSGQIAFPGGRYEETDASIEHTAYREIEEEIGIERTKIEPLGRMSDIYVPPSNFLISIFVGYLSEKPVYRIDEREVSEVIELDFAELLNPQIITNKSFYVPSSGQSFPAPCYATSKCDIWGASAMVISELKDILQPNLNSNRENQWF